MSKVRGLSLGVVGIALAGCLWTAATAAPWDILSLNRIEADPNKDYPVTDKNGPWLIVACTFSGKEAPSVGADGRSPASRSPAQQAHELVIELRKRYKLRAYQYEKKFELEKEVQGRGLDPYGNPVRMKYNRGSERDEIAVLIGDFQHADDAEAQSVLQRVRYLKPDCLSTESGRSTSENLAAWRAFAQTFLVREGDPMKKLGPMGHCFFTLNPWLPKDFAARRGPDRLVLQMNAGVDHSLLNCPGKFTLQVAHFTGRSKITYDKNEIDAIQSGRRDFGSLLGDAAVKAHEMTEALRKQGIPAFEFHDRYVSLVTVGSFNSVGPEGPGGVIQLDPRIEALIQQFRGESARTPKTLANFVPGWKKPNILFDAQPILVQVPKASISAVLERSTADLR